MKAARQYNEKAVEILKKVGFTGENVDLCLYMKMDTNGIVYIALYLNE